MKVLVGLLSLFFAGASVAQDTQLSIGVDMNLPLGEFGDFYTGGVGPAVGLELPVGDKLGVTVQASYNFLTPKSEFADLVDNTTMIPVHAGLKYYFTEQQNGCYLAGQAGVHSMTSKVMDVTMTDTNFSWSLGTGYQLEKFDIGARYSSISTEGESSSYVGLRVAYLLNL